MRILITGASIGETRKGKEIGQPASRNKFIWIPCQDCGKLRWVLLRKYNQSKVGRCWSCARKSQRGSNSAHWKGGRTNKLGYREIKIWADDFFYSMASQRGYVPEHRLVMAKHLGRCLHRWEIVHHKNHIRDDNRIENLQLVTDDRYTQITILENRIAILEKRITLLEAENITLQSRQEVQY